MIDKFEVTRTRIAAAAKKLQNCYPSTLRLMGEDTDDLRDFQIATEALDRIVTRWAADGPTSPDSSRGAD